MKKIVIIVVILFSFAAVQGQKTPLYSFFSAGHTYGNPNSPHYGLHYPFVDYFPVLNGLPNIEFSFLTGDVVVYNYASYWDSAQEDISNLNMSIYIAAGNHDIGQEFVERFGDYYYSFKSNNDLFIVLTPGLDSWNISGAQLEFLTNTLESNYEQVNNIFVFMHELIWWSPVNEYQNIKINFEPHYPGSTNFETVVKPLFLSYPNPITIYAGDLGATDQVSPFMYHSFDNITFIGSGMGGGIRDNLIITEVYEDSVYYNLVAINGNNPKALGELTDFSLSTKPEIILVDKILIYPIPASESLNIKNEFDINLRMSLFNIHGQLILSENIEPKSRKTLGISHLKSGIYFMQVYGDDKYFEQKVIVQ